MQINKIIETKRGKFVVVIPEEKDIATVVKSLIVKTEQQGPEHISQKDYKPPKEWEVVTQIDSRGNYDIYPEGCSIVKYLLDTNKKELISEDRLPQGNGVTLTLFEGDVTKPPIKMTIYYSPQNRN